MSGDHRETMNWNKKLLTNNGFEKISNTQLFKKKSMAVVPSNQEESA